MRNAKKVSQETVLNRAVQGLQQFSASSLATNSAQITREVQKRGATVITKHAEPTMVLMTIERYLQLQQAAGLNLDLLTQEFDHLYAAMQKPGVARKTVAALDLDR